ncbi:MAG: hypothetical protein ACFFFH_15430 [Candidatus Thorarchaeota archaeon]
MDRIYQAHFSFSILCLFLLLVKPYQALTYPSHIEQIEVSENFTLYYSDFKKDYSSNMIDGSWQGILDLHPRILNGSYNIKVTKLDIKNISLIIYVSYILYRGYKEFDDSYSVIRVVPVIFNRTINKETSYNGSVLYTKLNGTTWGAPPIPVCSYEAFTNCSDFGYCTFSAQLCLKDNDRDWSQVTSQSMEIEFSYQGFHDPVFYRFLQNRYNRNYQVKQFWKFIDDYISPIVGLLFLVSPFIGMLVLIKRGGKDVNRI